MLIKYRRVAIRLESRQFDDIKVMAKEAGFLDVSSFVRMKLFGGANVSPKPPKLVYEEYRGERRSFFCPNKLWFLLLAQVNNRTTASSYVRNAISEKLMRDSPEKKAIYEELSRN